jgi:hypothetical protein
MWFVRAGKISLIASALIINSWLSRPNPRGSVGLRCTVVVV